MITEEEALRRYTIGIFDGEGCVSTYKSHGSWTVELIVVIGSKPVVELMQKFWNGSIMLRKSYGPLGLRLWQWKCSGSSVDKFLDYAVEYSLVKGEQMRFARLLRQRMSSTKRNARIRVNGELKWLDEEELQERTRLAEEIRKLNGARARFAKTVQLEQEIEAV